MMDKHYIMYEEVTHVPLVLRYPALIKPESKCDGMVTNMLDLVPTVLEFAGLSVPIDLHGVSLMPYLRGEAHPAPRRYALTTYNGQQFGLFSQRMLRMGDFKYTWNLTDTDELYDLANDPYELRNVIADPAYAETLQTMRHRLLAELQAEDDCMLNGWTVQQLQNGRKL